jgi:GxxExxY protein
MIHEEITEKILKACFEVNNELGNGFLESVYEKALVIVLTAMGLKVQTQVPLQVMFRGQTVGEFFPDIIVEDLVIIELKAVKALASEHLAQVMHYLKATGIEVGLLVNFGSTKLEYRRFGNKF